MQATEAIPTTIIPERPQIKVLGAISLSHFLNDTTQSLILSIYPLFKSNFSLNFLQIGLITLTYQATASLLQPFIGLYTDRHPKPYSLPIGMGFTLCGLLLMSMANTYHFLLLAAAMVGTGSSVFHPESSRVARVASGGSYGLAQSLFQVGGNMGSSAGPLLGMALVMPYGQGSLAWFALVPLLAITVLFRIGTWSKTRLLRPTVRAGAQSPISGFPRSVVFRTLAVLLLLIFSKYFYLASINSYFIFYLQHKFGLSTESGQLHLFLFLFAVALGTIVGGPVGDRVGRKLVIWVSILGVSPFTLLLPYVNLFWTSVLIFVIGLILASAFSAIVVFAQELLPGRVGTVAGLFFGLSFGMGGVGAAVLGKLADSYGIDFVYSVCSFLPLIGLLTVFLPDLRPLDKARTR